MQARVNAFQQPIGPDVAGWTARPRPPLAPAEGRYCRLEPLSAARHAAELYQAFSQAPDGRDWTYMSVGPFASEAEYRAFAERAEAGQDPLHHAVIDRQRQGRGHAVADAHRSGQWRDRGGLRQLLAAAQAHAHRHRGAVPLDEARVRRVGLQAL